MNLIVSLFEVKDEVRYNEIKTALLANLGNDIIKKIVYMIVNVQK